MVNAFVVSIRFILTFWWLTIFFLLVFNGYTFLIKFWTLASFFHLWIGVVILNTFRLRPCLFAFWINLFVWIFCIYEYSFRLNLYICLNMFCDAWKSSQVSGSVWFSENRSRRKDKTIINNFVRELFFLRACRVFFPVDLSAVKQTKFGFWHKIWYWGLNGSSV